MGLFQDLSRSFTKTFTNPSKANFGDFATVLGTLGGATVGVASVGAARVSKNALVPVFNKQGRQVGVETPSFGTYLGAGAETILQGGRNAFKGAARGTATAARAVYSGGSTVLRSVLNSPKSIAEFVGQALPAFLAAAPRNLASAAQDVASGGSRYFDMLNGAHPGSAPVETSVAFSPEAPPGVSDAAPAGYQMAGGLDFKVLLLVGAAVGAGYFFAGRPKR